MRNDPTMYTVLPVDAMDDEGERILDHVERDVNLNGERLDSGCREYSIANVGNLDDAAGWIIQVLEEIEPGWREHVGFP